MANHAFIKTRKRLSLERLFTDLSEILVHRFGENVQVRIEGSYCEVFVPGVEDKMHFEPSVLFWLKTKGTIESRHSHENVMSWIRCVVENDLALRYEGFISDEGVEEKCKGTEGVFPTYRSWFEHMYDFLMENQRSVFDQHWVKCVSKWPQWVGVMS